MDLNMSSITTEIAVIQISGPLDLCSAPQLRQVLADAVAAGHRKLVVDLKEVAFLDCFGLSVLVGGLKLTRQVGGELRIAQPADQARSLLSNTTVDQILHPYASVADALGTRTI